MRSPLRLLVLVFAPILADGAISTCLSNNPEPPAARAAQRSDFNIAGWTLAPNQSTSWHRGLPSGTRLRFSSTGDPGSSVRCEVFDSRGHTVCTGVMHPHVDFFCTLGNTALENYEIRVESIGSATSKGRVDGWN